MLKHCKAAVSCLIPVCPVCTLDIIQACRSCEYHELRCTVLWPTCIGERFGRNDPSVKNAANAQCRPSLRSCPTPLVASFSSSSLLRFCPPLSHIFFFHLSFFLSLSPSTLLPLLSLFASFLPLHPLFLCS